MTKRIIMVMSAIFTAAFPPYFLGCLILFLCNKSSLTMLETWAIGWAVVVFFVFLVICFVGLFNFIMKGL